MDNDHDAGMSLSGEFKDVFLCRVQNGCEIIVNPYIDSDPDFVRTVISGELMAALLRQRGYLVLHGSCVTNGDNTIAFVGYSGWGKSTTAAFFLRHGYQLLSEDLLVVDVNKPHPAVLPGPQALKLKPDAVKMIGDDYKRLPKVYHDTNKVLQAKNGSNGEKRTPKPLSKIYLLEGCSRRKNEISHIPSNTAMVELVKHTRTIEWLTAKAFMKSHFNQCVSLLEKVPVSLLKRKLTLKALPETKQLIEEDLERSSLMSYP